MERERSGRAQMITIRKGGSTGENDILFKEDLRAKPCPGTSESANLTRAEIADGEKSTEVLFE